MNSITVREMVLPLKVDLHVTFRGRDWPVKELALNEQSEVERIHIYHDEMPYSPIMGQALEDVVLFLRIREPEPVDSTDLSKGPK